MRNSFGFEADGLRALAVLKDTLDTYERKCGQGVKKIARDIGRTYDHLIKCEEGKLHLHFDSVPEVCNATGDYRLLFELARQCKYKCVPISATPAGKLRASKAHKEAGEFIQTIMDIAEDGVITLEEAEKIRREGEEAKAEIDRQIAIALASVNRNAGRRQSKSRKSEKVAM